MDYKEKKEKVNKSQEETNIGIDIARKRVGMKSLKEYRRVLSYKEQLKRYKTRELNKIIARKTNKPKEEEILWLKNSIDLGKNEDTEPYIIP